MKKIIPTICMSLLGLSAIATSSYAWFSMNKTVTASGMKVQARAEGGIQIKRTASTAANPWSSAAVSEASLTALLPTSTADATANSWLHAEGTSESDGKAIGDYTTLNITDVAPAAAAVGNGHVDTNYYYVYDTYTVASDENSGAYTNLYVSNITYGTAANDLSSALRVLIKSGSTILVCAPVSGATTSYKVGGASGTQVNAVTTFSSTTSTIVAGPVSTADISVYIFFEGEDENLKTANIPETFDNLEISVEFKAEKVAAK